MLHKLQAHLVRQGPSLLRVPLKFTPFAIQRQILQQALNWQFHQALTEGELDFLTARWLKIMVRDLDLSWFMTVENGALRIAQQAEADVTFSGNTNDLILIAARKEDPDTLFFQRRLSIEGDTELGLYVKNLMDAIDLDTMPTLLRNALLRLADFIASTEQEGAVNTSRVITSC